MIVEKLTRAKVGAAKRAFTTRRVRVSDMRTLISGDVRPKSGDLVLAVVDQLGKHQRVELKTGRRARIYPGDTIIVAYGNRYAPDQFEALVSEDLGACDLVAGGGVASTEINRHERMLAPTRIIPLGLIGDPQARPLNLSDYAIDFDDNAPVIPSVVVAGTSMNSGKTMTSGSLARGFAKAGLKAAGIKSTGTGSGGDLWFMADMGASHVMDFTDAGLPGTYKIEPHVISNCVQKLIRHAGTLGCDVAVVEIADGLRHEETARLLKDVALRNMINGVVFAANDALGAENGVKILRENGHTVLGVSGQITRSPLAVREAASVIDVPILKPLELQSGSLNDAVLNATVPQKSARVRRDENVIELVQKQVQPDAERHRVTRARKDKPVAVKIGGDGQREGRKVIRALEGTQAEVIRWLEGP